jgi:hypothetical protein
MQTNSADQLETCLLPPWEKLGSAAGSYLDGRIEITRNSGTLTHLHELFHAAQDKSAGIKNIYTLTRKDAFAAYLLLEAAAVAYEMAARQEAENHHLRLDKAGLPFYGVKVQFTSDNVIIKVVFYAVYDAWKRNNPHMNRKEREAKALEAAGQAVVRLLLKGEDRAWLAIYSKNAEKDLNFYAHNLRKESDLLPEYQDHRRDLFRKLGKGVLTEMNFTPPEYLGGDAEAHIDKVLNLVNNAANKKIADASPPILSSARAPAPAE